MGRVLRSLNGSRDDDVFFLATEENMRFMSELRKATDKPQMKTSDHEQRIKTTDYEGSVKTPGENDRRTEDKNCSST